MTRMLMIGPDEEARIAALKGFATHNVMDAAEMITTAAKDREAWSKWMAAFSIPLPVGFWVTYSHETQPQLGLCRHISVSVDAKDKGPHPAAINMILEAFGMDPFDRGTSVIWQEDIDTGFAINVVQRLPEAPSSAAATPSAGVSACTRSSLLVLLAKAFELRWLARLFMGQAGDDLESEEACQQDTQRANQRDWCPMKR
jgi:hypothetical protein